MELLQVNRFNKEYINELPTIKFDGDVIMIAEPGQVDPAMDILKAATLVGFDTESKPSFKKGESYPVSLLQLSTQTAAYLFQLEKTGVTPSMAEFFANKEIIKIGVGIKHDIEKLQELRPFEPAGFIDLSALAREKGIIQVGARNLAARYLGGRLVKTAQKTNWAKQNLTSKQLSYAATDAWICLCIYPYLLADATDYRQLAPEIPDEEDNNE